MPSFLHHLLTSAKPSQLLKLLHWHDSGLATWSGWHKMPLCCPSWAYVVWHMDTDLYCCRSDPGHHRLSCHQFCTLLTYLDSLNIILWKELILVSRLVYHPGNYLIIRSYICRLIAIGLDCYGLPWKEGSVGKQRYSHNESEISVAILLVEDSKEMIDACALNVLIQKQISLMTRGGRLENHLILETNHSTQKKNMTSWQ